MSDLYDVLFLGINPEYPKPEEAKTALCKMLQIELDQLEQLLRKNVSTTIAQSVPLETAKKYQTAVMNVGGVCNYRTTQKSRKKLELETIKDEFEFYCPACSYKQREEDPKQLPQICPRCGTVPSKYDQARAAKLERERIQRRLIGGQELRDKKTRESEEREKALAREQKLEAEIRKAIGLPKAINSRTKLISSAAVLWLLGIGMGAGSVALFNSGKELIAEEQRALNTAAKPSKAGLNVNGGGAFGATQQVALEQAVALAKAVNTSMPGGNSAATANAGNSKEDALAVTAFASADAALDVNSQAFAETAPIKAKNNENVVPTGANSPSNKESSKQLTAQLDVNERWQNLAQDREWDLFLAAQVRRLIDKKLPGKAYLVADLITIAPIKIMSLGKLADYHRLAGNANESANVIAFMARYADNLVVTEDRADGFGLLAKYLWRSGDTAKANQYLETLATALNTLNDPAEKVRGLAKLAAYQAQIEQQAQAEVSFHELNKLVNKLNDLAAKVRGLSALASAYAYAGDRPTAAAIFNALPSSLNGIADAINRDRLRAEVVVAMATAGELNLALGLAKSVDALTREQIIFNLTAALAYNDQLYDAMKTAERLTTPEYSAQAAALVARLQRLHSDMAALAAATQDKAFIAQGKIAHPVDQTLIRGTFARYLAHTGQIPAAEDWGKKAMASAFAIETTPDQDPALALLTVDLARANLPKLANETLKRIKNPEFLQLAEQELGKTGRIFKEL